MPLFWSYWQMTSMCHTNTNTKIQILKKMNNTIVIFLQSLLIFTKELSDLRNVEVKLKIKSLLSKIIGVDSKILNDRVAVF